MTVAHRPDINGPRRELPGRVRRPHRLARRHAQARRSGPLTGSTLIHDPRGGARPARSRPMAGEGSRPWPDAQKSIVPPELSRPKPESGVVP